ncbi:hypothetical protein [Streptomyces antnestii]|uniref:hypothetical protein n=1 Tax=Streptomyces antnestii TaxID=2494256 RepID=UPI001CB98FA2|nr:hypothetical protein [Streptomyces sp. San01]
MLEARAVPVSEAARERIASCTDPDTLNRWLDLAVTAADTEELFREDGEEREV